MISTFVIAFLLFLIVFAIIMVYSLKTRISVLEIRLRRRKRAEKQPSLEGRAPALANRTLPENPMADFLP